MLPSQINQIEQDSLMQHICKCNQCMREVQVNNDALVAAVQNMKEATMYALAHLTLAGKGDSSAARHLKANLEKIDKIEKSFYDWPNRIDQPFQFVADLYESAKQGKL